MFASALVVVGKSHSARETILHNAKIRESRVRL
jgi:hypothetical protein